MASSKREFQSTDDGSGSKKAKQDAPGVHVQPSPPLSGPLRRVALNPADCDVDFDIGLNGLQGSALHENGFAYCWSGARASVGITGGKYCFGCKIIFDQPVTMEDTPLDQQHVCRVGVSRGDNAVGSLGESLHSFGFGGTGKFSTAGRFCGYGDNFGVGDTIVCCLDLETKPASIGFAKNGQWLGVARHFEDLTSLDVVDHPIKQLKWESAFFPHVLLKNVVVSLQFSVEDGLDAVEGYKPWVSAIEDGKALLGPTFSDVNDCELIMMVGLPASGKSTWAEKWMNEHPEKRYIILGTNTILDQMKVPGLLRKHNYGQRFECLMDRATQIFNTLLPRASKLPRNFILDQTNVYKSARKRKLKPFLNYKKIAVVIFPTPRELKFRADKRFKEMGKEVPDEAVNEMLANFSLPMSRDMPHTDEHFDQVLFPELGRSESQRCLDEMRASVRSKTGSPLPSSFATSSHVQSYSGLPLQALGLPQGRPGLGVETYNSHSLQFSSTYNMATHYPNPSYSHHGRTYLPPEPAMYMNPAAQYGPPPYGTPDYSRPLLSSSNFPSSMLQSRGVGYGYYDPLSPPMQPRGNIDYPYMQPPGWIPPEIRPPFRYY
ncbi:unnamed protein product [Cuscuta campestris]|uniref:SPRY domain-containing protein n=1 Tax=Cuscuta campestris TaxID=132261 RepID=A0A484MM34_9ASTE|nr:unnamed protein product [Cuscuta campestris]